MTDQYEIMPPSEEAPTATLSPMWLRSLFYIHIASLALSLVTVVWLNNPVTPWINHALSAGIVLCLLKLAPASSRYRTAAILTAAVLGCTLLSKLALGTLMNLAASVLAIIAAYQELHAHGEAVEEKDPKLSRKWCALFLWQLLIGILAGFASTAATRAFISWMTFCARSCTSKIIPRFVRSVYVSSRLTGGFFITRISDSVMA